MMKRYKAKEDFYPLYGKGDEFIILDRTTDERLLPIAAKRIKDGEVYYFNDGELEEVNGK